MNAIPNTRCNAGRRGFTLVELLVSMALIVFIMSILSTAFVAASKTFTDLKAAGDLAEKLRGAMTLLRHDLAAPHFDPDTKKLSDLDFWTTNNGPPLGGFVRIYQGTGAPSSDVSPVTNAMLHFTVALPGLLPGDFFSTDIQDPNSPLINPNLTPALTPPLTQWSVDRRYQSRTVFKSQYAEVVWWLTRSKMPDGSNAKTMAGSGPQQKLYTLHRRQRLIWPENSIVNATGGGDYGEVSTSPTNQVNRMTDATIPEFRLQMSGSSYPPYTTTSGSPAVTTPADILVDDVLSFRVQVLLDTGLGTGTDFVDVTDPSVQAYKTPTATVGGGAAVFDTWSQQNQGLPGGTNYAITWQNSIPLYKNTAGKTIRIQAIQVTLRLHDFEKQLTRQVTMVQEM